MTKDQYIALYGQQDWDEREAIRAKAKENYTAYPRRKIISTEEMQSLIRMGLDTSNVVPLDEAMAGVKPAGSWNELFAEIDARNDFHGVTLPDVNNKLWDIVSYLRDIATLTKIKGKLHTAERLLAAAAAIEETLVPNA